MLALNLRLNLQRAARIAAWKKKKAEEAAAAEDEAAACADEETAQLAQLLAGFA